MYTVWFHSFTIQRTRSEIVLYSYPYAKYVWKNIVIASTDHLSIPFVCLFGYLEKSGKGTGEANNLKRPRCMVITHCIYSRSTCRCAEVDCVGIWEINKICICKLQMNLEAYAGTFPMTTILTKSTIQDYVCTTM